MDWTRLRRQPVVTGGHASVAGGMSSMRTHTVVCMTHTPHTDTHHLLGACRMRSMRHTYYYMCPHTPIYVSSYAGKLWQLPDTSPAWDLPPSTHTPHGNNRRRCLILLSLLLSLLPVRRQQPPQVCLSHEPSSLIWTAARVYYSFTGTKVQALTRLQQPP